MKSTITLTSFVFMVAFFQSCFGLKCYQCDSKNNFYSKCGVRFVKNRYLTDCGSGNVCVEMIIRGSNDLQEHISENTFPTVGRNCVSKDLILTELEYLETLQKNGLRIDIKICNTNKCNGPLRRVIH